MRFNKLLVIFLIVHIHVQIPLLFSYDSLYLVALKAISNLSAYVRHGEPYLVAYHRFGTPG